MTDKTYNIQVLEAHNEDLCWNTYEELTKEAAERIIASCFNTQMSIADVEIYDSDDKKVKYKIKVECEIDTGEKMYVNSEMEKMVDAVKRYYDKQPKTILKKAKTIPMGNASDFSDFIHTRADEIKEEQQNMPYGGFTGLVDG